MKFLNRLKIPNQKNMAQIRDILVHVSASEAVHKRKCHKMSKHEIKSGEAFLEVRNSKGLGYKNYCLECARPIMGLATEKIAELNKKFN